MVISMCFSEFASTFFERPVRRNRWILWGGMVFSMILISDLHVNRLFWFCFLGAECVWSSQRHLRLHDFFSHHVGRILCQQRIREQFRLPGETFWAHGEIHVIWNIFKTNISKHVFEQTTTYFWTNNNSFLNAQGWQQLEHKMFCVLMCSHFHVWVAKRLHAWPW